MPHPKTEFSRTASANIVPHRPRLQKATTVQPDHPALESMTRKWFFTTGSQAHPGETAFLLANVRIKSARTAPNHPKGSQGVPRETWMGVSAVRATYEEQ